MSFKRFFAVALVVGAFASVSAEASAAGDFCIKKRRRADRPQRRQRRGLHRL